LRWISLFLKGDAFEDPFLKGLDSKKNLDRSFIFNILKIEISQIFQINNKPNRFKTYDF
jgi:hypothetical protein